ncbi:MAG: hypothetical protein EHM28_09115 [Spirochaetaceae bacterium]|nr:MAG: hypothetical protein EHM28_09115 [Spirochaetaceae bacterium]
MDGILLVDKPQGKTSHDVVDAVRRDLKERGVGHAGTLDPLATGLLVLGVGKATRLLEYMQYDKSSIATRFKDTGMLTPMSEAWDTDVFKQADARFGGQKLGELQISVAKDMPKVVSGNIFWDAINDYTEQYAQLNAGKLTVEQALQKTQEAAAARLK